MSRGDAAETSRGTAAAATWIVRGDETREERSTDSTGSGRLRRESEGTDEAREERSDRVGIVQGDDDERTSRRGFDESHTSGGALASPRGMTPRGRNGHSDPTVAERLEHAREHMTRVKNVEAIVFSEWKLEPWYWAPFPEEYHDQTLSARRADVSDEFRGDGSRPRRGVPRG